jgi:hypothetical protein
MPPISDLRTSQSFQEALSRSAAWSNQMDIMEPGEDFAPSAEVDVITPKTSGKVSQVKKAKSQGLGDGISDLQLFFWCLFIILSGFYLMFWRQEKFMVGFCGVPQTERLSRQGKDI